MSYLIEDQPKVAIIGRPNVGKSTLFNILTDSRKAVVKNQPGVTRDILIEPVEVWGKSFDIIDTGGITEAQDLFSKLIREQVSDFLFSVDLIVVVMDGRAGLLPEDRDLIKIAKQTGRPFMISVNKVDSTHEDEIAKADFYEFGVDLVACAFEQRRGVGDVLEWITNHLPERSHEVVEDQIVLSIVGKPNVGKSSLCNALLGTSRVLVSPVAGTTIDSVDIPFIHEGKQYILVDTAGLRRSAKREDDLEVISAFKSKEAIKKSNIVCLVIDGTIGPTEQDSKILESIMEDHRGVIIIANKIDLAQREVPAFRKTFQEQIERVFHFFPDVNVVYTSAEKKLGFKDLFNAIDETYEKMKFKVPTSELNDFFFDVIRKAPAPVYGTTNVKFYYLTQTYQRPPAFIAFANHPDGVTNAYRRFLIKNIKQRWDLWGIPIRIFCMKSRRS